MEVDIFKAKACKYFVDGYCMLTGDLCAVEINIQEGRGDTAQCNEHVDGDK